MARPHCDTPLVYLVLAYFFTCLFIENLPLTKWTTKVKSDINSVEVHYTTES
jgi:hypothetical protein